jgi:hypothetical protein
MPRELINPCTKPGCTNKISAQNKSGVCTPCQQGRTAHLPGGAASKRAARRSARASTPDADDAVLERIGMSAEAGVAAAVELAETAADAADAKSWFDKFVLLHQALGLDPHEAIEEHCRTWVETTTARALGMPFVITGAEEPAAP